jgi:AraC-like DNA-binding protein
MPTTVLQDGDVIVVDYRCEAGPADQPFAEVHQRHSISYVRRGSFGCRTHGRDFELVAGSLLIGYPGDKFTCRHDHHDHGDECLSIQVSEEFLDTLGDGRELWRAGALPPLAELVAYGELAQQAADGEIDIGLDEACLGLVTRFLRLRSEATERTAPVPRRIRGNIVSVADWIDQHCAESIDLAAAARQAQLTPYHFLRMFKRVVGVTPHQHLVRCRLRRAAQRLLEDDAPITEIAFDVGFGDLSNFVRTFHRAAGLSPRRFRELPARERNFFQDMIEAGRLPPSS